MRRQRVAGAVAVGCCCRPSSAGTRSPGRRAAKPGAGQARPVVLAAFLLQATAVAGAELLTAVTGDELAEAGDDLVLGGLRVTAVPGGLMFGVLVAAVVESEFGWATEQSLLARDPRQLRFAGLQLAVAAVLALTWWAVQSLVAVTVAACSSGRGHRRRRRLDRLRPPGRPELPRWPPPSSTGCSGRPAPWSCEAPWPGWSPCSPTGCWANSSSPDGQRSPAGPCTPRRPVWPARAPPRCRGRPWSSSVRSRWLAGCPPALYALRQVRD